MRLFLMGLTVLLVALAAAPASDGGSPAQPPSLPPPPGELGPRRIDFRGGAPVIAVKLMEGHVEVTLGSPGRLRLRLAEDRTLEGPAGTEWRIRRVSGTPARVEARIQLAELAFADKVGLAAAEEEWAARSVRVKPVVLGELYGVAGKIIDTRRYAVVVDQPPAPPAALEPRQRELLATWGVRTTLLESVTAPSAARVEVIDPGGVVRATSDGPVLAESPDRQVVSVRRVEYGVGYDFHGFEDRSFRGTIQVRADRSGRLAIVNQVDLEDLLKGLVPSEIFARAHPEALKAQAVTARGEVLAKLGLKHLADPYLLCSEQHCAVYRGLTGEAPSTTAAVEATKGEALFDARGRLVDSVYSAMCGGHTEHNEVVWGGVADPMLRGRPDVLPGNPVPPAPADSLPRFLAASAAFACQASSFSSPSKFRWERRFTAADVDARLAPFQVGRVMAMRVQERGVSGRARVLQVSGEAGATTIKGELTIRRLFGMLNSAMFEVKAERDAKGAPVAWTFTGGGWGHGVGLCQTGAIGRAEHGQDYRAILEHYFGGAMVARLYE